MNIDWFNGLSAEEAAAVFHRCCASRRWVEQMAARRPFPSWEALIQSADEVEATLTREDWLEAFAGHPRIGDVEGLRKKFAATATWSENEQAGVNQADEAVLRELAEGNRLYEERFGHIFIVCATGKSAGQMRDLLYQRLPNDPQTELAIAASEQAKITRLRLEKS